jgi:hypothetical protein
LVFIEIKLIFVGQAWWLVPVISITWNGRDEEDGGSRPVQAKSETSISTSKQSMVVHTCYFIGRNITTQAMSGKNGIQKNPYYFNSLKIAIS